MSKNLPPVSLQEIETMIAWSRQTIAENRIKLGGSSDLKEPFPTIPEDVAPKRYLSLRAKEVKLQNHIRRLEQMARVLRNIQTN